MLLIDNTQKLRISLELSLGNEKVTEDVTILGVTFWKKGKKNEVSTLALHQHRRF